MKHILLSTALLLASSSLAFGQQAQQTPPPPSAPPALPKAAANDAAPAQTEADKDAEIKALKGELDELKTMMKALIEQKQGQGTPPPAPAANAAPAAPASAIVKAAPVEQPNYVEGWVIKAYPLAKDLLTLAEYDVGQFKMNSMFLQEDAGQKNGVRYSENLSYLFQGYLAVQESGVYQLGLEYNGTGYYSCGVWIKVNGQEIIPPQVLQEKKIYTKINHVDLAAGLYEYEVYSGCNDGNYDTTTVNHIIRTPSDRNLRPMRSGEIMHIVEKKKTVEAAPAPANTQTAKSFVPRSALPVSAQKQEIKDLNTVGTISANANVRKGPSTNDEILGQFEQKSDTAITGVTEDGNWYRINLSGGQEAFVHKSLVTLWK